MDKRDKLTLYRFKLAAKVIEQNMNEKETKQWARQTPSREMKRIIRTAFGK